MDNTGIFPESWYPVMLSSNLRLGEKKAVSIFGTYWIIFRAKNNSIGLLHRYCPHMGTDLLNGRVIENCIECPLHRWRFNTSGQSTETRNSSDQSPRAKIPTLPINEKFGIIFVYWGSSPAFDIPIFPHIKNATYSAPTTLKLKNNYLAVSLNAFDLQHLIAVHNRIVTHGPILKSNDKFHLGVSFELQVIAKRWQDKLICLLGMSKSKIQYDCWGGNYVLVRNHSTNFSSIMTLLPGENVNESSIFLVIAAEQKGRGLIMKLVEQIKVRLQRSFAVSFLMQDVDVLKNMQPKKGLLSLEKDAAPIRFWEYIEQLPPYSIPE